jgi:hypothetical protein
MLCNACVGGGGRKSGHDDREAGTPYSGVGGAFLLMLLPLLLLASVLLACIALVFPCFCRIG